MKITIDKIERLKERADVSYEVSRDALEASNGDIIEAVIALERDGKLGPNAGKVKLAAYATSSGPSATIIGQSYGAQMLPQTMVEPNFSMGGDPVPAGEGSEPGEAFKPGETGDQYGGAQSQPGAGFGAGPGTAYGQPGGTYSQPGGAYGQPGGTYSQPGGAYGQPGGTYGQPGGKYGQPGGTYGQYGGTYSQGGGMYGQPGGMYGQGAGARGKASRPHRYKDESTPFEDNAKKFFRWLGRVLRASIFNYFEIWRRGERVMYFPVVLFLFCLIHWVFWVALVVLVIGLFCGCRYRFSGPHLGRKSVNDAMNEASNMADGFKAGDSEYRENGTGDTDKRD